MKIPKVLATSLALLALTVSSAHAEWRALDRTGQDGVRGVSAQAEVDGATIAINCIANTEPDTFEIALEPDGLSHLNEGRAHHANLRLRFEYGDGRRTPQAHAVVWYDAEMGLWIGSLTMNAVEFEHFGGAAALTILTDVGDVVASVPLTGSRKAQQRMREVCHGGLDLPAGILPDYFNTPSPPDQHTWQVVQKPDATDPGMAARITDGSGTLAFLCVRGMGMTLWFQHPDLAPVSPVPLFVHTILPTGDRYSAYGTPDIGPEQSFKGDVDFRASEVRGLGLASRVQVELGDGATYLDARNGNSVALYKALTTVCGFQGYESTPDRPECGVPDPDLSEAGCTSLIAVTDNPARLALAHDLRAEARLAAGDRAGAAEDLQAAAALVTSANEVAPAGGPTGTETTVTPDAPEPDLVALLQDARKAAAAGDLKQARALAEQVQRLAPAGAAIGHEAGYFMHTLRPQDAQ